jgi:hypothetical protein
LFAAAWNHESVPIPDWVKQTIDDWLTEAVRWVVLRHIPCFDEI